MRRREFITQGTQQPAKTTRLNLGEIGLFCLPSEPLTDPQATRPNRVADAQQPPRLIRAAIFLRLCRYCSICSPHSRIIYYRERVLRGSSGGGHAEETEIWSGDIFAVYSSVCHDIDPRADITAN